MSQTTAGHDGEQYTNTQRPEPAHSHWVDVSGQSPTNRQFQWLRVDSVSEHVAAELPPAQRYLYEQHREAYSSEWPMSLRVVSHCAGRVQPYDDPHADATVELFPRNGGHSQVDTTATCSYTDDRELATEAGIEYAQDPLTAALRKAQCFMIVRSIRHDR